MDGYEVARTIRRDPRWQSLRIIALTGYGQAGDRERSREAGVDAHLVKPVDFSLLERLLAETLGGKVG
jgi:CheY-like chemotaxis protein